MQPLAVVRQSIVDLAQSKGFSSVAIMPACEATDIDRLRVWIDRGYSGSMEYIAARFDAYRHPSGVLPGCRSLILLTLPYPSHPRTLPPKQPKSRGAVDATAPSSESIHESGRGTIAAYASGSVDYHDWIREGLGCIIERLREMDPHSRSRIVVDTAPLLERHFAHRAGLGWIGKNTMLIHPTRGSYFFLAAILTEVDLVGQDAPLHDTTSKPWIALPAITDHCGSCTACIDACPTSAFTEPRNLDASKCISYWTIEHRGSIPEDIRPQLGDWIFGCDVCQAVCPWNRKRETEVPPSFAIDSWREKTDCLFWLQLSPDAFRQRFRGTPFWRPRLDGMQRNAMIVAANTGCMEAIPILQSFLEHEDPAMRELANWALQRLVACRDEGSRATPPQVDSQREPNF
ncbi:MAG: tRNA epoxyqueuosine(34) reductase QueG [Pirellula sp.]